MRVLPFTQGGQDMRVLPITQGSHDKNALIAAYVRGNQFLPRELGVTEKVFEIPSREYSYGSFATDSSEASAPFLSRPCMGLAPGARG